MNKNRNRRPQTAKPLGWDGGRNEAFNDAMMEKGRSSATRPHRSGTDYRRKPKHVKKGWDY